MIGPELGLTQPGHDDRLRRQPHLDPRRLRRARVRDRHLRGRARARDPVPGPEAAEDDADQLLRASSATGVTAKDLILATIGRLGTGGMVGHAVEYAGPAIEALSMENRMTICNMTIEGGGRAGMIAPDETTFEWVEGRPGRSERLRRGASSAGASCRPSDGARLRHRGRDRRRRRSRRWSPGGRPRAWSSRSPTRCPIPRAARLRPTARRPSARSPTWTSSRARRCTEIPLDRVFIGSCTNSRIERPARGRVDRRGPQGRPSTLRAMVVPGSQQVKAQAEDEGLDEVFRAAGFEWRAAGCSMCLGMNPDILQPGRALRLDLEPQLRGPPGQGRAHPPGQPEDGRRGGDRGPLRRHPGVEIVQLMERRIRAIIEGKRVRCSTAPTSTPTRSSPSSS